MTRIATILGSARSGRRGGTAERPRPGTESGPADPADHEPPHLDGFVARPGALKPLRVAA